MIRYFKKTYPKQGAILSNGTKIMFPEAPSGVGLMAVDSDKRPDLIRDFLSMIARGRGGMVEISQEEFEDEKKKPARKPAPGASDVFSLTQIAQMRDTANRVGAELADSERKRAQRQLTPAISRSFKRPGMQFAGAVANPEPGQLAPGQWRPGVTDR